jgi:hypothetical protein
MVGIPRHITNATAINCSTGKEEVLTTKQNSRCHFFQRFATDGFEVGMRLDWGDIDENGNPMLDADFFRPGSNNPVKQMKKIEAHHTCKHLDPSVDKFVYIFEYESLKLRLIIQLTNAQTITGVACIKKQITIE